MSQIIARVSVCSGLTRYSFLRTALTSTGGSSNRVLDGAFQASTYSRSAVSNAMADALFIESSPHFMQHVTERGVLPMMVGFTDGVDWRTFTCRRPARFARRA